MKPAVTLVVFLSLSMLAFSTTIYVPDSYATIQGAIDASVNGDVVIVRPGTYVENIDFVGKAITVKSEMGTAVTTIDGGNPSDPDYGSGVIFQNGEGPDSVLDGFTLSNGTGTHYEDNPPFWHHCGGGLFCINSSPTITNNTISSNSASLAGGIFCDNSDPTITNNTISSNDSNNWGGGIYCSESSPYISNNTISSNTAGVGGGIVCRYSSSPIIKNNTISLNEAYHRSGGICCYHSTSFPTITNNIILSNSVLVEDGGGIFCRYSSATILNNAIIANVANEKGGGIYCYESSATITNNTITGNKAKGSGGGFTCDHNSSPIVTNTILWNNSGPIGKEISVIDSSTLTVSHTDVEGGQSSCFVATGSTLNWGAGMIDSDPMLIYYHLAINSPCKDAGDNSAQSLPTEDYDGDPRIAGGTVDIGADEFYYHLFKTGDVVPGRNVEIWATGLPTQTVKLGYSSSYQLPPVNTPHGYFYLTRPLMNIISLPDIWPDGYSFYTFTVPTTWVPGERYYLQAFLGPWWGPTSQYSKLTNPIELMVE